MWGPLSDEQGEETVVRAVDGTEERVQLVGGVVVFYFAKLGGSRTRYGLVPGRKVSEGAKVRRGEDAKVRACTVGRSVGRSVDWSDGRAVKVRGDRRAKTGRDQR